MHPLKFRRCGLLGRTERQTTAFKKLKTSKTKMSQSCSSNHLFKKRTTLLRKIVAFTRPAQASAAILSDPFWIPTRPPNSTFWDEVDLNHDGTKPSHPLDTCSIVPTPPPSPWQESAKGIGGDAPALRAAGNTLTMELLFWKECTF